MSTIRHVMGFTLFMCSFVSVSAQTIDDADDLALAFGDEDFISIATGRNVQISRAPAVATVITADDIKLIGATDLDQVLETVPGLHVSNSSRAYNPIYTIRGIYSEPNQQILMLVNSIPITNVFAGDRSQVWGGMPVKGISRIEIIRGPGSAIYGADAFAGVINIVTKTSSDIDGTEFGARVGSFNDTDGWFQHGGQVGNFDLAFSLELHNTDGQNEVVDADSQSFFDPIFGTDATLAPGPVNNVRDNIDARIDLSNNMWRLRMGYQRRNEMGAGAGVASSLDPTGKNYSDRFNTDITYQDRNKDDDWDFTVQLSYFDTSAKSDLILFPSGSSYGGPFPNGVIGNPDVYERHTRLGFSAFYTGIKKHDIRMGTGFNYDDLYRSEESKNFFLAPGGIPVPLGAIIDVSNDPSNVFIQPHDREAYYAFLQDEWSFAPDWDLTAGVRYDHYSDFGDTVNPRFALVWQTRYNMTSKLLYGHAFRAPSFAELYNINNPVALGNSDLNPESIDTAELAFNIAVNNNLRAGLNLFHYKMSDILRFVADPAPASSITARNTGDQTGSGFELESSWDISQELTLSGNLAYQDSEDEDTNSDASNAPQRQLYVRANWEFRHDWTLNGQANWVADRKRAAGDTRPEIDDYTTVDVTLRHKPENSSWEFAFSGHNILDEDVREPSLAPGLIPNDLPLAGSSYYLEVGYHL